MNITEERWICENSFYVFLEKAWGIIDPGHTFIPGWSMQALSEHLEALYNRDVTKLVIK